MKKLSIFLSVMLLGFGITGMADATLWDRGWGLIYDDVLDITWLQDANYAATELTNARRDTIIASVGSVDGHALVEGDFDNNNNGEYSGKMTWWGALAWADQLVYGGYDDWRLPDPYNFTDGTGPDAGYGVMFSEMGFLYHNNLGGPIFGGILDPSFVDGNGNIVAFENLGTKYYWYGTTLPVPEYTHAWVFSMYHGLQRGETKVSISTTHAWPVRPGDVASTSVPDASVLVLLSFSLVGLVGFGRKSKK